MPKRSKRLGPPRERCPKPYSGSTTTDSTVEVRIVFPFVQTAAPVGHQAIQGPWATLARIDRNRFAWGGAVFVLVALYLAFTIHDSVNNLYSDDWTIVGFINSALHHHLTLDDMWSTRGGGENRVLFPYLAIVGVGLATNDNTRIMVVINAVVFSVTYLIVLVLLRAYLRRSLTVVLVLVTGLIWFSLIDYFNALFGFQFAWYLILLCFVGMVYFLLRENRGLPAMLGAMALAIIASYSSVQGLLLWIMGLLCLLWPLWHTRGKYIRKQSVELVVWLVVGAITTAIYFWNYAPKLGPSTSTRIAQNSGYPVAEPPTWALSHPGQLVQFFLVDVGNVIPQTGLVLHELIGASICVVSVFVLVQCFVLQRRSRMLPLPIALIIFGLLWDVAVATGRLSFGLGFAYLPVYTMSNLLVILGIACYGLWWLNTLERTRRGTHARRSIQLALAALAIFLLVQIVTNTEFGLNGGNQMRQQFEAGARTTVILGGLPYSKWTPYESYGVVGNVYLASYLRTLIPEAKADHLGPFGG